MSEFRVNTITDSSQESVTGAMFSDGSFVLIFNSPDPSGYEVYGQRYDETGIPIGDQFQINSYTSGKQFATRGGVAAVLSNDNLVVVWSSNNQDGSSRGIYAQRYDNSGNTQGDEFKVNTYSTGYPDSAKVQALYNGGFVVVWHSNGQDGSDWGVYSQRYDNSGNTLGTEFRVNTETANSQCIPSIGAFSGIDGGFVIVWISRGQDGSGYGIYGQLYDNSGNTLGTEFKVNTTTNLHQFYPVVAVLLDNSFLVTWESNHDYGIYGQLYYNSGNTLGTEFKINGQNMNSEANFPAISGLSIGGFVAAWKCNGESRNEDDI